VEKECGARVCSIVCCGSRVCALFVGLGVVLYAACAVWCGVSPAS